MDLELKQEVFLKRLGDIAEGHLKWADDGKPCACMKMIMALWKEYQPLLNEEQDGV